MSHDKYYLNWLSKSMTAANASDANRKVVFEKVLWPRSLAQWLHSETLRFKRYLLDKTHIFIYSFNV